jgi:hypothetical protein
MHAFRLKKVLLISTLTMCAVAVPVAMRQVIGQGDPASGGRSKTAAVAGEVTLNTLTTAPFTLIQTPQDGDSTPAGAHSVPLDAATDAYVANRLPQFDLAPRSQAERKIEEQLDRSTQFEFTDEPLSDAIAFIERLHGIQILLDRKALEDVNIAADTTINVQVTDVSLKSALRHMLNDIGLTYTIRDEVLLITTPEVAHHTLETRVYRNPDGNWSGESAEALIEQIKGAIAPNTWSEVGGNGYGDAYGRGIIIVQTREVHEQINALLRQLRELEVDQ